MVGRLSDELASNSEDEKKLKKVQKAVGRKGKQDKRVNTSKVNLNGRP